MVAPSATRARPHTTRHCGFGTIAPVISLHGIRFGLPALLVALQTLAAPACPQAVPPAEGTAVGPPQVEPASKSAVDVAAGVLDGVASIASAGVPGPLAVFGDRAVVLVAGAEHASRLPVAAAAEWGRGRVIAFGHGGMIGGEALRHEGTARFVLNAAKWLSSADAAKTSEIGVLRNDAVVALLATSGVAVSTMPDLRPETLARYAAVVVDAHALDEAGRAALAPFVRDGGGLLTAGLGWGWLQLHPGESIDDHPGNLLLRECGVAWCDGTLEPTAPGAFAVDVLPASMHSIAALDALENAANSKRELDPQSGATLISAFRVIPREHALFGRAEALRERTTASLAVSQARPLARKDALARALMALDLELERRLPAEFVPAHVAAAEFPGAVPLDAPRVERTIELALATPGWQSTGLYAPAGELITVTSPAGWRGGRVRIGCHTDELWHHDRWNRVPDIARQWPLQNGSTRVASAFGGLVYLELPGATARGRGRKPAPDAKPAEGGERLGEQDTFADADATPLHAAFTIAGAVEAPRYVLGTTTDVEWQQSRMAPGPWGELESGKVILSVPSSSLRGLDDPASLLRFWDRISDAHATLAAIPLEPARPHRFVPDIQISAGYMHSGYPIMTHLDAVDEMTSLEKLQAGTWGLLHELGHNHQEGDWTFDGTGEVTCNLFALHAIDTVCTPKPGDRGHPGVNEAPSLAAHIEAGAPFEEWKRDPFLALHMYVQLQRAFGWETFKRVFAEYRALPASERPRSEEAKRDQWMVRFSRACGRNLGPFFQAWGVPTSEQARSSIADLQPWMPDGA